MWQETFYFFVAATAHCGSPHSGAAAAAAAAQKARSTKNVKKPQVDVILIDMGYDRMEQ